MLESAQKGKELGLFYRSLRTRNNTLREAEHAASALSIHFFDPSFLNSLLYRVLHVHHTRRLQSAAKVSTRVLDSRIDVHSFDSPLEQDE